MTRSGKEGEREGRLEKGGQHQVGAEAEVPSSSS